MRSAANVSQILRLKSASDEARHLPVKLRRWIEQKRAGAVPQIRFMHPDPYPDPPMCSK